MVRKKKLLFCVISLLSIQVPLLGMITHEDIHIIENNDEPFIKFIKRVKDKCGTAKRVVNVKNNMNNGFMSNFFDKIISSAAKDRGYEGIDPEDAQMMQRFFSHEENTTKALEIFSGSSYNLEEINNTFEQFNKGERKLVNLIQIQHGKTLNNLGLDEQTHKAKVREMFHEKEGDSYIIPDDVYQEIITRGLIEEYIFAHNADKQES